MNLETKITIYKFTPQVFTLTLFPDSITLAPAFCNDVFGDTGNGSRFSA